MSVCRPCVVCLLSVWRKSPSSAKPEGLKWKVPEVVTHMFAACQCRRRNGIIRAVAGRRTMNDLTIAEPIAADAIRSRILTIRGVQVILDRDLAELYGVTTGALNQAVKRNKNRFPERFMFQLTKEESENLKSQSVISSWGGSRSYPYAFTEQGIAMLSSVLRSETAILVSIRIMDVFVAMRKALASFSPMLMRLDMVERRQIIDQARNEERFKLILNAMQDKKFPPQKVFYDGQIYDAFEQMKKFMRMAKTELIIIDPYFDDSVLPLIAQKRGKYAIVKMCKYENMKTANAA